MNSIQLTKAIEDGQVTFSGVTFEDDLFDLNGYLIPLAKRLTAFLTFKTCTFKANVFSIKLLPRLTFEECIFNGPNGPSFIDCGKYDSQMTLSFLRCDFVYLGFHNLLETGVSVMECPKLETLQFFGSKKCSITIASSVGKVFQIFDSSLSELRIQGSDCSTPLDVYDSRVDRFIVANKEVRTPRFTNTQIGRFTWPTLSEAATGYNETLKVLGLTEQNRGDDGLETLKILADSSRNNGDLKIFVHLECFRQYLLTLKGSPITRNRASRGWAYVSNFFAKIINLYLLRFYSPQRLVIAMVIFYAAFTTVYFFPGQIVGTPDSVGLNAVDRLYYSMVTFTTLGYGDFHPITNFSKFVAALEALAGALSFVVLGFSISKRYG